MIDELSYDYSKHDFGVPDPLPQAVNQPAATPAEVAAPVVAPVSAESDKKYASKTYAQITRDQWDDYMKRFVPIEDELIASYQNPEQRAARIDYARNTSDSAFNSSVGVDQRQAARYGINKANDPAYTRRIGLGMTAASVDATNQVRAHLDDKDKMLLSGGISTQGGQ